MYDTHIWTETDLESYVRDYYVQPVYGDKLEPF